MAAPLLSGLLLAAALVLGEGPFEGYTEEAIPTGKLRSLGWPADDRLELASRLPAALARVESTLGRALGRPFTLVLVPGERELRRLVERLAGRPLEQEGVLGVAIPRAGVIVLARAAPLTSDRDETTLLHEVAHLVIHRYPETVVPRWFDEGAAMWASAGALGVEEEAYLSLLARMGALYSLESLDLRFPRPHDVASVAYGESLLLVRFIEERCGPGSIPALLDLFEAGIATRPALEQMTGLPLPELEKAFHRWVAGRQPVLRALASVISIWTVIGLLALLAIVRYRYRRRRALEALGGSDTEDPDGAPSAIAEGEGDREHSTGP
ncbi:MAG TPA: hypothetical protein VMT52_10105 [Planctomycetota bacterium]|nr:hypothetical protein [Planctomycetota bacterium]